MDELDTREERRTFITNNRDTILKLIKEELK
jgi:hypothetical protein